MKTVIFLCLCALSLGTAGGERVPEDEAITSHIPRQAVASSGIARVGYSKRRHVLEIEFNNGAVYRYTNVAPSVYRDLLSADSKARYYDLNIKGNYRSVRVRPRIKDRREN